MAYEITWHQSGVRVEFTGFVSENDIESSNRAVYENSRFPSCAYQIFDFSKADLSRIELDFIPSLVASDADISEDFPLPSLGVVTTQPIAEAMVFHYKNLASTLGVKWLVRRFDSLEEATAWTHTLSKSHPKD